ncbi:MAG: hypothetical protein V4707_11340 [Pseudomonadota bacterium]
MRILLIAAALFAAAPAFAQSGGTSATLAAPAQTRTIVDGATWSCQGTVCTASGGASQPAARACRRVVARIGKVSAFTWRGTALSAEQLAACNA